MPFGLPASGGSCRSCRRRGSGLRGLPAAGRVQIDSDRGPDREPPPGSSRMASGRNLAVPQSAPMRLACRVSSHPSRRSRERGSRGRGRLVTNGREEAIAARGDPRPRPRKNAAWMKLTQALANEADDCTYSLTFSGVLATRRPETYSKKPRAPRSCLRNRQPIA